MKGATMSFSGAICGVILLLMAAVVCGQTGWGVTYTASEVCAPKGSTVEINCSYTYPTTYNTKIAEVKTFWFIKETGGKYENLKIVSEYLDRVEYHCTNNNCTLKISNLRKTDSNVYKFRFIINHESGKYTGLPGVSLSVTVQVQVNVKRLSTGIELTCHNDCQPSHLLSYIWLENGKTLKKENSHFHLLSFNTTHRYQCAIKGHEHLPSPAVYVPRVPLLSVTPSGEIVEGSQMTLNCSSDANPPAKYTIYRVNGNQTDELFIKEVQKVFILASGTGRYYCTAENDLGGQTSSSIDINVKYSPKTCIVSVIPSGKVEEGKLVNLICKSDANPAAEYTWYKEKKILPNRWKDVYHIFAVTSEDRGNYSCMSKNQYGQCNSSSLFLDVLYAPKVPSVSITSSGEIMEGSSVTLACSSNANPAATYTWYREKDPNPLSLNENLILNSIDSSKSGQYYYAPRVPSVSLSLSGKIVEGSSVTLTCSSDANPAPNYTWYKEGEESPKSSGQNFTISSIQHEHSGKYYCKVQNKIGCHNSTVAVTVVAGLSKLAVNGTIVFIVLIMIFLFVFLILRKRRASKPSPKPGGSLDNIEQCQRSQSKEDVQYASIRFLRKQRDPVYENFKPGKTGTPSMEEEEEQGVEYATVKFANASFGQRTESSEPGEDSDALYSVINKIQRPKLDN
ncbi:B-cell receptor CD22 [Anableps anableps]